MSRSRNEPSKINTYRPGPTGPAAGARQALRLDVPALRLCDRKRY